jgi:hypothetical protein
MMGPPRDTPVAYDAVIIFLKILSGGLFVGGPHHLYIFLSAQRFGKKKVTVDIIFYVQDLKIPHEPPFVCVL